MYSGSRTRKEQKTGSVVDVHREGDGAWWPVRPAGGSNDIEADALVVESAKVTDPRAAADVLIVEAVAVTPRPAP